MSWSRPVLTAVLTASAALAGFTATASASTDLPTIAHSSEAVGVRAWGQSAADRNVASIRWSVSVEFRCDSRGCFLIGQGGVEHNVEAARIRAQAAVKAIIERQIKSGAKPTGQVDIDINATPNN